MLVLRSKLLNFSKLYFSVLGEEVIYLKKYIYIYLIPFAQENFATFLFKYSNGSKRK